MLPFDLNEYQDRINKTKLRMSEKGIEVLLITNPANMNYLSGYDGWSFYVDQMLIVIVEEEQPIWIGRAQDASGAKATTWLYEENIIPYPEDHIHSETKHPMDFIAGILKQIGQSNRTLGVEMSSYFFSALAYERLKKELPHSHFIDASLLVNWVRLIKSDKEIEYMKKAAVIVERAMSAGIEAIQSDVRECDVVADIYHKLISGTDEYGGDYPAIVPLMPSGEHTSAPHLTWSDRRFHSDDMVIVELAGCYRRYHSPLARTVSIGKPSDKLRDLALISAEGLNTTLNFIKPGMTCGEVEDVWTNVIAKYGITKDSRLGYSMGLNYPPDWGEHTASLRKGDQTILRPNMTFHLIPGLWFDNYGIEISEAFRVTANGCETFANFKRELFVKDNLPTNPPNTTLLGG